MPSVLLSDLLGQGLLLPVAEQEAARLAGRLTESGHFVVLKSPDHQDLASLLRSAVASLQQLLRCRFLRLILGFSV